MSSNINVYAVSIEQLKQVVGSEDQAAVLAIVSNDADFLASIDAIDPDAEMACAQAVAELIDDDTSGDAPGYLYGYAMQAICSYVGEALGNIGPIAGASGWIEGVDALLERIGIPVSLTMLVYRGCPVPIPEPDDYPFIGVWPPEAITEAKTVFDNADLSGLDPEMSELLQQIREWVGNAGQEPGASIIGFMS